MKNSFTFLMRTKFTCKSIKYLIPIQLIVFKLFSQENSDGNGKSLLPFQVRSNDAVPKRKIL